MPVSKQASVAFTIHKIAVDMQQMSMGVTYLRTIDGVPDGNVEALIVGQDMVDLIGQAATAGQSIGDEFTNILYTYGVNKGLISGTIS